MEILMNSAKSSLTALPSVIALSPQYRLAPHIAIAAGRAGAVGVLDLGIRTPDAEMAAALAELVHASRQGTWWGLRIDLFDTGCAFLNGLGERIGLAAPAPVLLLAGIRADELRQAGKLAHKLARIVHLEVRDLEDAQAAQRAGFDGVILKGYEAGGRVSRRSAFMLAQECAGKLTIPYWIQGGIGVHTAAAVMLAGANGVVLGEQLWQAAEAPPPPAHLSWAGLDGSETVVVGTDGMPYRCFGRTGRTRLREIERAVAQGADWQGLLLNGLLDTENALIAMGADVGLAGQLAAHYGTVGRIVTAVREAISTRLEQAGAQHALQPGSPLALAHGTRFPIVQGPMTRVSDVAPFARAVAGAGALPFVALAVLRRPEVEALLNETRAQMGALPWGVGLLGFVPRELREEQLAVVREIKPPFAIIAGGRPSQARELVDLGIDTYLHVPSPGLLRSFLDAGARHFVFEGSECGGHTGPRSSFVLWEQAVDMLAGADVKDPGSVHVLFAGGIHDPLSAAMVALIAAPLCARGMKIGVLMGTAYLFTEEIVASGAIVEEFQRQAVNCAETALLQSGVGIYTRCAKTAFCGEFEGLRRQLILESKSEEETLMALELMNIGRLRVASKGVTRNADPNASATQRYVPVDAEGQRRDGLYMLGEVARLRDRTCSLADLHHAVSVASTDLLQQRLARIPAPAIKTRAEPIAIVGMAAHFPKAQGLRAYWQNIVQGIDAIREVSDDRWVADQLFDPQRGTADKVYSKWGGFLDDIAFDPRRYGIAPATLRSIEPAQLLTLEAARQALEDAGFGRRPFARERTSCIMAVGGMNDLGTIYNFRTLLPLYLAKVESLPEETRRRIVDTLFERELPKWTEDSFPGILGNVVAGRIANRLDLGGSNFTVDAACASSLAALEIGFRQLRDGQADVALVGGVDCTNSPIGFMCFAQTHALSPRGRSRPFDSEADGIAISEGVGVVVLKRLSDAERDGDRIYALVNGVGSASDGRHRSLTAPHPPGQVLALRRAYEDAGVDPGMVTLVEAHGTGTSLGDRSEVTALESVLGPADAPVCALGSVKSMIGHTKVAAGLAGMIKAALALQHRVLPPTLGVDRPIPALQAPGSRLYVNTETRPWLHLGRAHPRYCGVSAFGFGGTNFHAVMSEYTGTYRPDDKLSLQPRPVELFAFAGSGRSEIVDAVRKLLDGLDQAPQVDMAELAFALFREQHVLRRANGGQPCRLVAVADSIADLCHKLRIALAQIEAGTAIRPGSGLYYRETAGAVGGVCFLFPGQGAQRINMLRDLVTDLPELHACFVQTPGDHDSQVRLADLIYPLPAFDDADRNAQQQALNATDVAQPALGIVNMAAFDVLTHYGLHPDFLAGHSYGEYVALCAAGAISRADLLRLSLARGRLAAQAPAGAMAALDVDGASARAAISRHGLDVAVANLNAPDQTIIAGATESVDAALPVLAQAGMRVKRLPVGAAFHCAQMAPLGTALADELDKVMFSAPRAPVYANLTAAAYPDDPAQMRTQLVRHIAEPVRFVEQVEAMYEAGARVFVECGPGLTLTGLVARILGQRPHTVLAIDAPGRNGWVQLAHMLAQAEAAGLPVNLAPWFAGRGLVEAGLDDTFARARKQAEYGPMIWRVNGGRAMPWAAAAPAPVQAKPVPVAAAPVRDTRDEPSHNRRTMMTTTDDVPDIPSYPAEEPASAGAAQPLEQFHDSLAKLLAFQSEQQQSLRQYFDLQGQLVESPAARRAPPRTVPATRQPPGAPRIAFAPARPARQSVDASIAVPKPPEVPPVAAPTGAIQGKPVRAPVLPPLLSPGLAADSGPGAPAQIQVSAAPAVTARTAATASLAEFEAELLQAVSDRTGYPIDMLDMDAHMEADLGIDSIKRIEIFSNLAQRHNLAGERDEEKMIEDLSGFKTLKEVVAWYANQMEPGSAPPPHAAPALPVGGNASKKSLAPLSLQDEEVEAVDAGSEPDPVLSYVVQVHSTSLNGIARGNETGAPDGWPVHLPVVLVGKPSALAAALREALEKNGHVVRQLAPGPFTRAVDAAQFEVDFSSLESLSPIAELLSAPGEPGRKPIGALINLMGCSADAGATSHHRHDARALFMLLKVLGPSLRSGAGAGAAHLINVTAFDGCFGLGGPSALAVGSAGTLGVAKSAAREWPDVRVKCIDAAPGLDPARLAERVIGEMYGTDTEIEVGFTTHVRHRIGLVPRGIEPDRLDELVLEPGSVVLVTGGAYGITADLTRMLAQKYRPRLVLVGRSALPDEEDAATRAVADVNELRRLLTAQLKDRYGKVRPAQVEAELNRIMKERQIRANLAALRDSAGEVEYHCLDVRDGAAFGALIDDVYRRCGRIDGVLHGAGVISDKLIASKPLDAFDAVFDTKVIPALTLADRLDMASLRFIVFLSSVAGRFGNIGQVDYSAANEVLNKLAGQLSHAWPHLHALAINWGPWNAGMVNDDLRRLYAARSIRPIAPETGRRHFLDELARGPRRQAEIVISSSIGQIAALRLGGESHAAQSIE
jgi:acyl transferase domain-containing protein/NAD(P)H-dependent flavin oxidoreductase YrpB (nitropropane dioxygenase family)/NAD(P)-dependent dehydrogenase (short-subunit alcohol dehydrogenase family)